MKKNYIHIYLLGILLLSVACTGKFREFNTDQSGITDEDLIIDDNGYGIRLGIIQQGIYFNYDYGKGKNWPFQLIQNLNADMFSGYMHDGISFIDASRQMQPMARAAGKSGFSGNTSASTSCRPPPRKSRYTAAIRINNVPSPQLSM